MKPTVTIVTICYNAAAVIENTIRSVLNQTYMDYEYVFVDGASKDNTVDVIESFREKFEEKGICYCVNSEPDNGIYDAMNKGILHANGEWVIMLNAGDVFVGANVLKEIYEGKDYTAEVVYGNTVLQEFCGNKMMYKKVPARSLDYFEEGMVFCHQSVFVRTKILRQYLFDTSFKIVADYEQFIRMYKDGVRFEGVETYVSVFDASGVSMAKPERTLLEYAAARKKNNIIVKRRIFVEAFQRIKYSMRRVVRTKLPKWFYSQKRGWGLSLDEVLKKD